MKTLILDNYDSFTFNLYQEIGALGGNPDVHRNDAIAIDDVASHGYSHIVIGPGPGNPDTPRDIGISDSLIELALQKGIPLLGVCLGHQILGRFFGATVQRTSRPCHGAASPTTFIEPRSAIFSELPKTIDVMRYHSLCVESPQEPLRPTAMADDGTLMGLEHRSLPIFGVQFHPESIGTPAGRTILHNFLGIAFSPIDDRR